MDIEEYETPEKTKSPFWSSLRAGGQRRISSSGGRLTPRAKCSAIRKGVHPRTPNGGTGGVSLSASTSTAANFQFFSAGSAAPASASLTPPAKRFHRVRNPFEAALTERLHLPLIASPSLFQRPATPQLSSTQFEWTIDEVSSMQPANVEPHETQFHDSPDPDYEAKAQSAISSYFKEQQIVPSPVDCPLRTHRIILSEINGSNTPMSKPGRRIRDAGTQTELTLPAVLPQALEDALRPYFQPQLAGVGYELRATVNKQRWKSARSSNDADDIKDISLRRKLFDIHGFIVADAEGRLPAANANSCSSSPTQQQQSTLPSYNAIMGKLSESSSLDKSGSCGSLSPISASDWLTQSPHLSRIGVTGSATKRKSRLQSFAELGELSPIRPLTPSAGGGGDGQGLPAKSLRHAANLLREHYRSAVNSSEQTNFGELSGAAVSQNNGKFTPDRSSSPVNCLESTAIATACGEFSTDSSFNIRVSRLVVNSAKGSKSEQRRSKKLCAEAELFGADASTAADDTEEMLDLDGDADEGEEDDMQVSQLSAQSSCSSQSDTPRSKRRSASRKNLSQSFNANWLDDEEEAEAAHANENDARKLSAMNAPKLELLMAAAAAAQVTPQLSAMKDLVVPPPQAISTNFYRVDSGFNEMSCSSYASYGLSQSTAALLQSDEGSREAAWIKTAKQGVKHKEEGERGIPEADVNMRCSTPSSKLAQAAAAAFSGF